MEPWILPPDFRNKTTYGPPSSRDPINVLSTSYMLNTVVDAKKSKTKQIKQKHGTSPERTAFLFSVTLTKFCIFFKHGGSKTQWY